MAFLPALSRPNLHESIDVFDGKARLGRGRVMSTKEAEIHECAGMVTDSRLTRWQGPGGLSFQSGRLDVATEQQVLEQVLPGLKLGLVFSGRLDYRPDGCRAIPICGPVLHLSVDPVESQAHHRFPGDQSLEFLTLRLPVDLLAELGIDPLELARGIAPKTRMGACVAGWPADAAVLRLGRQLTAVAPASVVLPMYRTAKALELAVAALERLAMASPLDPVIRTLRPREARRLQQARELLLADLRCPPGLAQLARAAGTNVSQLTAGFRRLFGCSVYDFVREQRMQLAWRLLEQGRSVSEVAYACGYTDSHFSKAFHKRFGRLPSDLRA